MSERNISSTLKTSLLDNDPFTYFHLVKFEKPQPSLPDGAVAGKAEYYTYITDAPYNISWDDGSVDAEGNANGAQTYIANKLLKVGNIQETTEARATAMSIQLSTIALGANTTQTITCASTYLDTPVNLVEIGFREGDKVLLDGTVNSSRFIRFDRFTSEGSSTLANSRVYFTVLDGGAAVSADTASYTLSLESEELKALTRERSGASQYSNYINREVFIYKAHATPNTGAFIGTPFLLFKGIISQGSLSENPESDSSITWGLTSHWGDFVRVQGRLTSDSAHRALNVLGDPDTSALIRDEYRTDFGFSHAEQSINVLATYQAQEVRYRSRRAGGLSGLLGGKKIEEYYVTVDRDVDLRFDLTARYLPVVYGVQRVPNIPVFADVQADDPAEFYVVFALCEGEIGGILDIYVDDNSSVCLDELDASVRDPNVAGDVESVDVVCNGRADTGSVLAGGTYRTGSYPGIAYNAAVRRAYRRYVGGNYGYEPPNFQIGEQYNTNSPSGITHEKTYSFTTPIDAKFVVHSGKPDQVADLKLVDLAAKENFKIQSNYFSGEASDYWGTSHRLLDTAYVQAHFTLSEGEETIPDYEFIVKGKYVNCRNYDHSFKIYSGDHTDYEIGDVVNLSVDGDGGSHSNVQIIDKWTMYDKYGNADVRFRWATDYPNAGDTLVNLGTTGDTVTMTATAKSTIVMRTWNHVAATGTTSNGPTGTLSAGSYSDSGGNGLLTATITGAGIIAALDAAQAVGNNTAYIAFDSDPQTHFLIKSWSGTTATFTAHTGAAAEIDGASGTVFISNLINGVSSTANDVVEISRVVNNAVTTRSKEVLGSNTTYTFTKEPFTPEFLPAAGDSYTVYSGSDDRVTINPAMQLMDYITSRRYGRGLLDSDLNIDTWLESARLCDDRSKITIASTSSPTVGDVYKVERPDGSLIFQGTVSDVNGPYLTSYYEVEFDNIIGKLGYKWTSGRVYKVGDFVWYNDTAKVSNVNTTLTLAAFTALSSASIILTKVSGSGPATITVNTSDLGQLPGTNPIVRAWNSGTSAFSNYGYSLHDSDDVKYWKYLGWDEPEQRYVTRHQMNQIINTSTPIFDNINSMLRQFNGILRYANGKYELDIKTAAPASFTAGVDSFSEDDIIGQIKIDDKGQKNSFNSISAGIVDPQNKFGSRSISFFDSTYLKEDKGIPKQGNYALPGITNYYSARTNIVQFLKESRYGLNISFNLGPSGYLLLPGNIIALSYNRFDWVDKLFRVEALSIQPNGLVTVTASEHNDDAFLVSYIDRDISYNPGVKSSNTLTPPTNLQASQDLPGMVQLTWTNSAEYDPLKFNIEVWGTQAAQLSSGEYILDSQNDPTGGEFVNAVFLDFANGDDWTHIGLGDAPATEQHHIWFYWIRYSRTPSNFNVKYSPYEPTKDNDGVIGKALSDVLESGRRIALSSDRYVWEYDGNGNLTGGITANQATVTATAYGTIGTPYYQFFLYANDGTLLETSPATPGVSNTYTYSPPEIIDGSARNMPETVLVELREFSPTEAIRASDVTYFNGVSSSSDAIYISIPNPTHIIPYDWTTSTTDYTGSGTTITVYEGNNKLTAVVGPDLDPGQFKVAVDTATGITAGSITPDGTGTFMVVGDHSAMTGDIASITFDITVQRLNGSEITFQRTQTFTKVQQNRPGRVAFLTASDYSVVYDETDQNPSYTGTPPNITLTYDSEGYLSPQYRLTTNGVADPAGFSASTTGIYTVPTTKSGTSAQLVLEVREGASGTEYATDSASIIFVSQSESGLSGVLTNENHTVSADQAGGGYSLTGSGGTFEVFSGGQDVTTSSTFSLDETSPTDGGTTWSKTKNGLTLTINKTTGVYSLSGASWTTVIETFNLKATYAGTDIIKTYTISKALAGIAGRAVFLVASDYSVVYDENDQNPNYTGTPPNINLTYTSFGYSSPEYRLTTNGVADPAGFSASTTGIYTVPTTKSGTSAQLVLEARENSSDTDYTSDSASIIFVTQGVSGLSAVLTNENHTVPTLPDGTGYSLSNAGGSMEVFNGGQDVTASSAFAVVGGTPVGSYSQLTKSGVTIRLYTADSAPYSKGDYVLIDSTWTSDLETFDLQATYNTSTITKTYTISKAIAGYDGVTLSVVPNSYGVQYDEAGENPDPFGTLTGRGAWESGVAYNIDDVVRNSGISFVCKLGHTSSSTNQPPIGGSYTTYWELLYVTSVASSSGLVSPLYRFKASFGTISHGSSYITDNTFSAWQSADTCYWRVPPTAFNFTPQIALITVEVSETGAVVAATDAFQINGLADGYGAITVEITNPKQGLTQVGNLISYDNSDSYIVVWEGDNQLDYAVPTTALSTSVGVLNKWKITKISYGGGLAGQGPYTSTTIIGQLTSNVDYPSTLDCAYAKELGVSYSGSPVVSWQNPDLYSGWIEYEIQYRRAKQTTEGPFYIQVRQYLSREVANTDGYVAFLSNASAQVPTDAAQLGYTNANFSNTDTRVYVYKGGVPVPVDSTDPYGANTWRIISGNIVRIGNTILTPDSVSSYYTAASPNYANVGDISADPTFGVGGAWTDPDGFAQRQITVTVREADGVTDKNIPVIQNFTRLTAGQDGADGADGIAGSDGSVIAVPNFSLSVRCDAVGFFYDWNSVTGLLPSWSQVLAWRGDTSIMATEVTIITTGWTNVPGGANPYMYKWQNNLCCIVYTGGTFKGFIYFYSAINDSHYSFVPPEAGVGSGNRYSWLTDEETFSFQTYTTAHGYLTWNITMNKNYGVDIAQGDVAPTVFASVSSASAGWIGIELDNLGDVCTGDQLGTWNTGDQGAILDPHGDWCYYTTYVPPGEFECKIVVDPQYDGFSGGEATGSWLSLNWDRYWYKYTSAGVTATVKGAILVRHIGTQAQVANFNFELRRT